MTTSSTPDDSDDQRYVVEKHGRRWLVEDVLNRHAEPGKYHDAREDAQHQCDAANERNRKRFHRA